MGAALAVLNDHRMRQNETNEGRKIAQWTPNRAGLRLSFCAWALVSFYAEDQLVQSHPRHWVA